MLPPSSEPRATGHITQIVELIERLIDTGHAYTGAGDVYFDVLSFPEYGALSGHRIDDVHQGEGVATGKRDQRDFTLWKGAKPGEPSWPTPWGRGRPGWHSECVAMAHEYLGAEFDIHCGGMDLVFPHHENEIAQACAAGDGFARFWLHNGWVTMGGEKMSKSLGNVLSIPAVLQRVRPAELRYYLGSAHYRSMLEFSEVALQDAVKAYTGIEDFLHRVRTRVGAVEIGVGQNDSKPRSMTIWRCRRRWPRCTTRAPTATGHWTAGDHEARPGAGVVDPRHDGHPRLRSARRALGVPGRDVGGAGGDRRAGAVGAATAGPKPVRSVTGFAPIEIRDRLKEAGIEVTDTADGPQWCLLDASGSEQVMAGNSQRRGAVRKAGTKKGPTVGSGGVRRRGLEGRGATPPAHERPNHPAAKRANKAAQQQQGRPKPRRPTTPRSCSAATRCWSACAPGCLRPRSTSRSAPIPTSG